MESSVRRRVVIVNQPYVTIRGLIFRHNNTGGYRETRQRARVNLGSYGLLEICDIQWGDWAGVARP
jgi:hypothetical protein